MWKEIQHAIRTVMMPVDVQIDARTAWDLTQQMTLPVLFAQQ
jgi:hypothetical protein